MLIGKSRTHNLTVANGIWQMRKVCRAMRDILWVYEPTISKTYTDSDWAGANASTTYTASAMSFGTAVTGRYVVVAISWFDDIADGDLTSATIGGVSATIIYKNRINVNTGQDTHGTAFIAAQLDTGTSGDVVLTWTTATCSRIGIAVYRVIGMTTTTAYDTASEGGATSVDMSVNVKRDTIIIASGYNTNCGAFTWSLPMVEDFEQDLSSNDYSGAASSAAQSSTKVVTITTPYSCNEWHHNAAIVIE